MTRAARAQAAFLVVVVLLVAAFGYLLVVPGHWVRGTAVIAVAMVLAALLRLCLPGTRAGMLAVRARWIDVLCYGLPGVLILAADLRLHH